MKQVIMMGLGNPGPKYQDTRHNAGFLFVDQFAHPQQEWRKKVRPDRQETELTLTANTSFSERPEAACKCLLVKPLAYMNNAGQVAAKVRREYPKAPLLNWYVIHDDLDLRLGQYKIQLAHGPKDHNGLISIYTQLGSMEFWHVRIGIDGRGGDRSQNPSDYVLQTFSPDEKKILDKMIITIKQDLTEKIC